MILTNGVAFNNLKKQQVCSFRFAKILIFRHVIFFGPGVTGLVITELAAFKLINFYDFKDIFLWKKSTLVVAIPYPWGYPTALDGIKWVNKDVNYETISHEFEFRWGLYHFLTFQKKIKIYYCSHIVKFLNSKHMKSFRL